jgi:nitrate reductase gamma subunit
MEASMYEFIRGPLLWIAFAVFVGGSLFKLISMYRLAVKEKSVIPTLSAKYGLRSLRHWIIPFNATNMRLHPVTTIVSFSFHICLLLAPLFAMGHAVLWNESFGISWYSLHPLIIDIMTLVVIFGFFYFVIRRIVSPTVRNVTSPFDFIIVAIVVSPFVTGFIAHHQLLPYENIIVAHVVCGVLWLMAIPFTRLAHMFWFVFSRAYMGSEFGAVRNARDW